MDYISKSRKAAVNRGHSDPTPAELAKEFGSYDQERRAQILDTLDDENSDEPMTMVEAEKHLSRREYTAMLRKTHHVLRRQGR